MKFMTGMLADLRGDKQYLGDHPNATPITTAEVYPYYPFITRMEPGACKGLPLLPGSVPAL